MENENNDTNEKKKDAVANVSPSIEKTVYPSFRTEYLPADIDFQSVRDVQYGLQMGAAFLCGALIAFKSKYGYNLNLQWVLPVLSTLLLMDTVGGTIQSGLLGIISFTPTCIFIQILRDLGMGYENYVSCNLFYIFLCFIVGYMNPKMQTRRIALVLPSVLIANLVTIPRILIPDNFVFNLLEEAYVAISVAIAISAVIFPRFACVEVQDRFVYSLKASQIVLEIASKALMCKDKLEAEAYLSETELIIHNLHNNQLMMTARLSQSLLEPAFIVRRLFRGWSYCCSHALCSVPLGNMRDLSAIMQSHLTLIVNVVKDINFDSYHEQIFHRDAHSMEAINAVNLQLQVVVQIICNTSFATPHQQTIESAVLKLEELVCKVYETLSDSVQETDKDIVNNRTDNGVDTSTKFNAAATDDASDNEATGDGNIDKDKVGDTSNTTNNTTADQYQSKKVLSPSSSNFVAISCFLFHMKQIIDNICSTCTTTTTTNPAANPTTTATQAAAKKKSAADIGYAIIDSLFIHDWWDRLLGAVRCCCIMGLSFVFVENYRLQDQFENGQWIMFAMIMCQGDNLGATFAQVRLRLLGTMMGALYSYFTYVAVGSFCEFIQGGTAIYCSDLIMYKQIYMFVPFIVLCGVIKQNKNWSYFGSIASTTSQIVTYGRVPFLAPVVGDYVLLRIQENAIGILLVLACSLVLYPPLSGSLLNWNLHSTFLTCGIAVKKMSSHYNLYIKTIESIKIDSSDAAIEMTSTNAANMPESLAGEHPSVITSSSLVKKEIIDIRSNIAAQLLLLDQVSMEQFIWVQSFPEHLYRNLVMLEHRIVYAIFSFEIALFKTNDLMTHNKLALFSIDVSNNIKEVVMVLIKEVLQSLFLMIRELSMLFNLNIASNIEFWEGLDANEKHFLKSYQPKHQVDSKQVYHNQIMSLHMAASELHSKATHMNDLLHANWLKSISLYHTKTNNTTTTTYANATTALVADKEEQSISTIILKNNGIVMNSKEYIQEYFDVVINNNALIYSSKYLADTFIELQHLMYTINHTSRRVDNQPF